MEWPFSLQNLAKTCWAPLLRSVDANSQSTAGRKVKAESHQYDIEGATNITLLAGHLILLASTGASSVRITLDFTYKCCCLPKFLYFIPQVLNTDDRPPPIPDRTMWAPLLYLPATSLCWDSSVMLTLAEFTAKSWLMSLLLCISSQNRNTTSDQGPAKLTNLVSMPLAARSLHTKLSLAFMLCCLSPVPAQR